MKAPEIIALGALIVAMLVHVIYKSLLPKSLPGIPYNHDASLRFVGDVPELLGAAERRRWIIDQPRKHNAPLAQIFTPMRKPFIILSDYRAVSEVLSRRWKVFDRGPKNLYSWGFYTAPTLHLLLNTSDPRFRQHRELLRDLMMPEFLHNIAAPRVYENIQSLITLWRMKQEKSDGHPFDVEKDISNHFMDAIRSVAFGLEDSSRSLLRDIENVRPQTPSFNKHGAAEFIAAETSEEAAAIIDATEIVVGGMKTSNPWFFHTKAILTPKHLRAWFKRKAMIDAQTAKGLKRLSENGEGARKNALDQILWREMGASRKSGHKPNFYSPAIRHEMLGFLMAGHDTTATATMWFTRYMTNYQQVQKRLREDLYRAHVSAVKENRQPSTEELATASVPYLDAVVQEVLRHNTPVHIIARCAMEDTQILGYPIPKGTNIMVALTGPGTSEAAIPGADARRHDEKDDSHQVSDWNDADVEVFSPQRWLKVDEKGEQQFDSKAGPALTFSSGPRACWGKKLAYMQMKMLVTLMLWNFDLQPLEGQLGAMDRLESFTTKPKYVYVKL